jgi:NAD(P)H dehydrogenase (quinone)
MSDRRTFPATPTTARAVVLTYHPYTDGFVSALAEAWTRGAMDADVEVTVINVASLSFDPALRVGHREDQPLEPDLIAVKAAIEDAAHLVIAFPTWWGGLPATLKGLFDRLFLPGWAFSIENGQIKPGLKERSARILTTMDAPVWYDSLVYGASGRRQLRYAILQYSGVKPVWTNTFGKIGDSSLGSRERMLAQCRAVGQQDAKRLLTRFPTPSDTAHHRDSSRPLSGGGTGHPGIIEAN